MTEPSLDSVVRQRAVLVLSSTAEFDSRTYRIASALVARGHDVAVLARWRPGLADDEVHPTGYRIRRVRVSVGAGLPLSGPLYRWVSALRRRRERAKAEAGSATVASVAVRGQADLDAAPVPRRSGLVGRLLAVPKTAWRITAIVLVVRAQGKASRDALPPADLYHGMTYMGIPVALDLARRHGGRVVYDARDIYVDAGNLARLPRLARAIVGRRERGWARRAARVVTVNRPYAEVMASRWQVEFPLVVLNCSYRYDPPRPRQHRFHDALGLSPDVRIVLYQGGIQRDRGIEQLIEAIPRVERAVLVLLGYGGLWAELERRAADPNLEGRLRLLRAVGPGDLLDWVACADVVAMPIQPTNLNHRLTTPNKLFEAMAAGVPVVASDLPGMADIVRESGCGRLVDPTDSGAIATAISAILDAPPDERAGYGERGLAAAHATYNWESQVALLVAEYSRLTGKPW